jgi:hypothetical protein
MNKDSLSETTGVQNAAVSTVCIDSMHQIMIFITGQNKESLNQIFSPYTKASRKTTHICDIYKT